MSDINQENPNLNDENDDTQPVDGKKKLTDTQLRIIQVVAGILSAAALVASMLVPSMLVEQRVIEQDSLLNYLFVAVFLVIMFGRRSIENKYRLRLGLFSLALIDGILVGVMFYVVRLLYMPENTMAEVYKVLIIVGAILLILIAGVLVPFLRYRKRLANGTVIPIRIPEKPQQPASEEAAQAHDGPTTIEQRVAAMMREMDSPSESNTENKDE